MAIEGNHFVERSVYLSQDQFERELENKVSTDKIDIGHDLIVRLKNSDEDPPAAEYAFDFFGTVQDLIKTSRDNKDYTVVKIAVPYKGSDVILTIWSRPTGSIVRTGTDEFVGYFLAADFDDDNLDLLFEERSIPA